MTSLPAIPHAGDLDQAEALLDHFEQIEARYEQVRQRLARSHRLTTLGTLAAIVAHEYHNILTPVLSYAQMALGSPEDVELMRKALDKALHGADRAARLSSSVLGFVQESDGRRRAELGPALDAAVATLGRDLAKDGIELHVDAPPGVCAAIEPVCLQQVILNLLLNARKAMRRSGGKLSITGRVVGERVHVAVRDTGPGIPPAIRQNIFEPFVTHPTDDNDNAPRDDDLTEKGTGLGLCICRDLLAAADGAITVAETSDQGTAFHIDLPLADNDTIETT